MTSEMTSEMTSDAIPTLTHAEYLDSVFDQFAHLAIGRIDLEYVGSALDTNDDDCLVMLHEIFEQHWNMQQMLFPGQIPDDYPIDRFFPDQYLKYSELVEEIGESTRKHFKLLQSSAEQRGIMYFTLNIIARVNFNSSVYHQVHVKETRDTLFEINWDSRTGSSDCHSQILEAFEKMLDKFMEVECLPENSRNFLCTDRYLLKECMRRFAM